MCLYLTLYRWHQHIQNDSRLMPVFHTQANDRGK